MELQYTENLMLYLFGDLNAEAWGASCAILTHQDPKKVWILSFDTLRYQTYQHLGIEVGCLYEKGVVLWEDLDEHPNPDSQEWREYIVFECERLIPGDELDLCSIERTCYKRLKDVFFNEWGSQFLPQKEPAIQSLFYAAYTFHRVEEDWGSHNVLFRANGTIFLSDVLHDGEEAFPPHDVWFKPDAFDWIVDLVKGKEYELA